MKTSTFLYINKAYAWEQRKLGELVQFINGRAYKQEELLDVGKYKVVRVGNFNTNEKWYFSDLELETDKYMDNGALLYLWATSFGPVIWQGEKAIFHYHIWKLNNFESLDKKYLYSFLEWDKNKISQNTNGSTMVHITKNMIEQRDIEYPTKSEQYRIGSLLESVDNLITLHQRKYDALKTMKKTLLSKMFPKDGEDVPEIRFKGYTDAWEQRKLGSEFKKVNERNDGTFGKGHWISVAKMYFQDPEKVQSNNIDTRTYVMRLGDIAFEGHPNNEFQFGRFVANDIGNGVVSELFPVYRHKTPYYNNYWKYAIQQERIMAPIFAKSITSSGNSSNKLDPKHFLRQKVRIATLDEQKNIGDFLVEIDNLITLHQRKLEELKNMKKTLLQQMFV